MRKLTLLGALALGLALLAGCGNVAGSEPAQAAQTPSATSGLAGTPLFSSDGTRVAYGWRDADGFSSLMVQGLEGSDPVVLYRDPNELVPLEWSPDGDHILTAIRAPRRSDRLVLVSLEGFLRRLVGNERKHPNRPREPSGT